VKKHRLYPFYQSIKQEFNSHNRKIKSCKESLGYVADGVVQNHLLSILIGHWIITLCRLPLKLDSPFIVIHRQASNKM
jgi:hypothetical protein